MTAIGSKLYVFGGRADESTLFNDLHVFDTGANRKKKHAFKPALLQSFVGVGA